MLPPPFLLLHLMTNGSILHLLNLNRVGGALRLRPLTPPYVPFGIRRFNNLSISAGKVGLDLLDPNLPAFSS